MTKLELDRVSSGYSEDVLNQVSFSVNEGEFVGIVGPNGAGKSTIVKTITNLLPLTHGRILVDGQDVTSFSRRELARRVAVVSQHFSVGFDYKVEDIVRFGRYAHADKSLSKIKPYMEWTGVWQFRARSFHNLSGGEQQRVILSQALAQEADLMLLDEPTSDLDIHHQVEVFDLIDKLRSDRSLTVLAVLHDLNLAALYCDRIIAIKDGRVVSQGTPVEVLTEGNIKSIYGVSVDVILQSDNRPVVVARKSIIQ